MLLPFIDERIRREGLEFRPLTALEKQEVALRLESEITFAKARCVGAHRAELWERCWAGMLDSEATLPEFLVNLPGPVRLNGRHVLPSKPDFLYQLSRRWKAHWFELLRNAPRVFEFGCGSGFNLQQIQEQFPIEVIGLDWSLAALAICHRAGIEALHFDFFNPPEGLLGLQGAGVVTCGALEQVGFEFRPFAEFLLRARPSICIHIEPVRELYSMTEFDARAAAYHEARGYLTGFLPWLKSNPSCRVLQAVRARFGNMFNDGFSVIVWKPI